MAFEVNVSGPLMQEETQILLTKGIFGFYNYAWSQPMSPKINQSEEVKLLEETSKKRQMHEILINQKIIGAIWSYSEDLKYFNVQFKVYGSTKMDEVMEEIRFKGYGAHFDTSVHVYQSTAFFYNDKMNTTEETDIDDPEKTTMFQSFIKSVQSRMTVVQIYQNVKDRGQLTFDYLCFLVTAAAIATLSLSTNNYPGIVASMLLSPLMDPILAILFGTILQQRGLFAEGLRTLSVSLLITIMIGFLFGIGCHFINFLEKVDYPTSLMMDKGKYVYLLSIIAFAIASAPNLSTALLSNNSSAQIGNAISLSLLPPVANTGFLWFLAIASSITKETNSFNGTNNCSYKWLSQSHEMIYFNDTCLLNLDFILAGIFSIFISIINIIILLLIGYWVFKLKRLASNHLLRHDARKFYDKDLKEAYTPSTMKTLKARDPNTALLSEMVKDYAKLMNKSMTDLTREDKKKIFGDLRDIAQGATEDVDFQNFTRAVGRKQTVKLTEALNKMELSNELKAEDISQCTFQEVNSMNPNLRRSYLRFLSKRHESDHIVTQRMNKKSSVGRFEVSTNPPITPLTVRDIEFEKRGKVNFHL